MSNDKQYKDVTGSQKKSRNDGNYASSVQECAKYFDSCVWFHTLYGCLDGLSVSYSTVKFLCDATANSNQEYREHLEKLLTNPGEWLPVLLLESLIVTGFSMLGNYGEKQKKAQSTELHYFTNFTKDYWPYLRDVLKGVKNGYKGIKGLTVVLTDLDIVKAGDSRAFFFPVGLIIGSVGMINRIYKRYLNGRRKELEQELIINLNKLKPLEEVASLDELNKALLKSVTALQDFQDNHIYRGYITSFISGFVDGPYLFAGIMGLATLMGPMLIAASAILAVFLVAAMVSRTNEEYQRQRKSKKLLIKAKIALKSKEINGTTSVDKVRELIAERARLIGELKQASQPNYASAVFGGVQDGLSAFGALSSIYFALGIILLATGTAFPPALIFGGMVFGLVAMMGFSLWRLYYAHQIQKRHNSFFEKEKEKHQSALNISVYDDENKKNFCDKFSGPDEGEYYFQGIFEVLRCMASGPYKSQNLATYLLSVFQPGENDSDDPSSFVLLFMSVVSVVYGLCLAIRAFASSFKHYGGKKPAEESTPRSDHGNSVDNETATASPEPATSAKATLRLDETNTQFGNNPQILFNRCRSNSNPPGTVHLDINSPVLVQS